MKNLLRISGLQKLLVVFLAFIVGMIICRVGYSGKLRYVFLLWNLFLAWIPFKLSLYLSEKTRSKWKNGVLLAAWLLFFPNALYIITDLVHLEAKTNVPLWFDMVLLFASAIMGLIMAFASLYKVEVFLTKEMTRSAVNKLVIVALFLGSFGVYLGRFLRWNSWDIITNPIKLFNQIAARFLFPLEHYRTWSITLLLTCLFTLLYYGMKNFSSYTRYLKQ